jgi:hypothetical protein
VLLHAVPRFGQISVGELKDLAIGKEMKSGTDGSDQRLPLSIVVGVSIHRVDTLS